MLRRPPPLEARAGEDLIVEADVIAEAPLPGGMLSLDPQARQAELAHRMTELVGQLRGLVLNKVLLAATVPFDATGTFSWSSSVPFASVAVYNDDQTAGHLVTVEAGSVSSATPTQGRGVVKVNPGRWKCVALTGTALAVYGNPGSTATLVVYEGLQPPGGGDC